MALKDPKTFLSQPRIIATVEFIQSNRLQLRPPAEVAIKMRSVAGDDPFSFQTEVLADYVDLDHGREFFTPEYLEKIDKGLRQFHPPPPIDECAQDFLDYMNFAWGKAEGRRGLSANRSIVKLKMWLWLMSRDDLAELIGQEDLYYPYGAPALIAVCEKLGIDVPTSLVHFVRDFKEKEE